MSERDRGLVDPFEGPGEMRELGRSTDWASTSLGPVEGWSPTLRDIVRTCLASPFPINLWCGPELLLIYNDAYRDVLGTKHPAALGRPGAEVWREIWVDIRPLFEQIRAGGPPVYAADAPFVVQRAGEPEGADAPREPNAWFTFALSPVRDEDGEIVAFLNIVAESSRRIVAERARAAALERAERAEARLLDVFAQAPAFIAVLRGRNHRFEYVNRAYYRLVGDRELIGRTVDVALPELRGQGFTGLLDRVLRTGEPYVGREVAVVLSRGPDGSEQRFADFVYYPIREADGTRSGIVAHGYDVTDHVRARQEAQRARAEAEEANRSKSQFLATISHEIRTPINAIVGYTDLLELGISGPLTDAQKTQLERIRDSSRHLRRLIDDVLDLAKVEAGRLELEPDRVSAPDAVAAAVALIAPQAAEREISVHVDCPEADPVTFVADESRVRQILANLLSNAVKFTAPGGRIDVVCGTLEDEDGGSDSPASGRPYVRVTDTGIGIGPDQLEQIFRPFAQLDSGHTRREGGTGLGLTISRDLARLMGGELTVRSRRGEGSTFTLWLPGESTAVLSAQDSSRTELLQTLPPNLESIGAALLRAVPELPPRFVERLREEPGFPVPPTATDADLADHTASFLADIAQTLIVLGSGREVAPQLLRDGSEIQRLVAELHGRQRAALGWTLEALSREWRVLEEEIEAAVRRGVAGDPELHRELELLGALLERGERLSRRSLRHALSAAAEADR